MTFLQLYGEELSLQLASEDTTERFTTARRKAQVNAGMREFARLTDCLAVRGSISLSDEVAEYDLEATLTDFWWLSEQEGLTVTKNDGTTTTYYTEGRELTRKDARRMDREHPGWRAWSAGTPRYLVFRVDGGRTYIGLAPAPDVGSGETWALLVPYLPSLADMSDDADLPFTVAGNASKRLEPWHQALVHYAASKLEKARKQVTMEQQQLALFAAYVQDYRNKQRTPGGDEVSFAHHYFSGMRRGAYAGDPMVDW